MKQTDSRTASSHDVAQKDFDLLKGKKELTDHEKMASLVEEDKISQINSKEAVSSGSDSHPRQAIEDLIVINDMKPGFENANDLYSRPKPLEDSSSLFTLSKYLEEIQQSQKCGRCNWYYLPKVFQSYRYCSCCRVVSFKNKWKTDLKRQYK